MRKHLKRIGKWLAVAGGVLLLAAGALWGYMAHEDAEHA
jgi:hypothetical protein